MRAAVDAADAVLFERRHVGEVRMAIRSGHRDHAQLAGLRLGDADAGIEGEIDDAAERSLSAGPAPLYGTWFSLTFASRLNTSVAICGEVPLPGVP